MAKKKAAKSKSKVSKSQAVRDQLKKNPNGSAAEIAKAASKQVGGEVTPALVYNIKSIDGSTKKKRRKKKVAGKSTRRKSSGNAVDLSLVREAASLLQQAGGDADAAKEALELATAVTDIVRK